MNKSRCFIPTGVGDSSLFQSIQTSYEAPSLGFIAFCCVGVMCLGHKAGLLTSLLLRLICGAVCFLHGVVLDYAQGYLHVLLN